MLTRKATSAKAAAAATATLVSLVSAEGENEKEGRKEGGKRADATQGMREGERETQLFHPLPRRYSAPPSSPECACVAAWLLDGGVTYLDLSQRSRSFPSFPLPLSLSFSLSLSLFPPLSLYLAFCLSLVAIYLPKVLLPSLPRFAPSGGRPLWRAKLLELRFHLAPEKRTRDTSRHFHARAHFGRGHFGHARVFCAGELLRNYSLSWRSRSLIAILFCA